MPSRRFNNLQPAHRGYWWQDLIAAYWLVKSLVVRADHVVTDRKDFAGDRIDDLEVSIDARRVRRQFKASADTTRRLADSDFAADGSSLRFDRLVLSYAQDRAAAADEFRLCATWIEPAPDDTVASLLEPIQADSSIGGVRSRCYRLAGDSVWPAHQQPAWPQLAAEGAQFDRDDVLEFCRRFVIELGLPPASNNFAEPGVIEQALIGELADRVGIGRYPNTDRTPADVAALAIALATQGRIEQALLTPSDIEANLGIRTDFGHVSQAYPLDSNVLTERPPFHRALVEGVERGEHQLVVGGPGMGKSWELTQLADELRSQGFIVARHYCYLAPGDSLAEQRVTTDVFFANLLWELLEADPALSEALPTRYAAGLDELDAALRTAAEAGHRVALIVDGIDHIARVRADAHGLTLDETDIVERLATVDTPNGVVLVVGSQPGSHLNPLRERFGATLHEVEVPTWQTPELLSLSHRLGLDGAFADAGIDDARLIDDTIQLLASRAEGNPLYATYLTRGLVAGLGNGSIDNPVAWLEGFPPLGGNIAAYYAHLYSTAPAQTQAVGDILGVIDFAVTEDDLRAMLPAFVANWIPADLGRLAPVLTAVAGQGGLRVFHESFRRFMRDELERRGRSIADALAPVIDWLKARGFYRDARSFRFLPSALQRAGRESEVVSLVTPLFVAESVVHGHELEAVLLNLRLAADIAARTKDWVVLARCTELHRAAHSCYGEGQNDLESFWDAYLEMFGATATAERLLFDGNKTVDSALGLRICSEVDDDGGTPPWAEYLAEEQDYDSDEHYGGFDDDAIFTKNERTRLAELHGITRLEGTGGVVRWSIGVARSRNPRLKSLFLRKLAARLCRSISPTLVEHLAKRANRPATAHSHVPLRNAVALLLGGADYHAASGNTDEAKRLAELALSYARTSEEAASAVALGASPVHAVNVAIDPDACPLGLGAGEYLHDAIGVRGWVAAVRLLGDDDNALSRQRDRVAGEGWYRCWLRFVISLAKVAAARITGDDASIVEAFAELQVDTRPFVGNPRACDLYPIHRVIGESLAWGLSLLSSTEEWTTALGILSEVSHETSTSIDREEGGPLHTSTLLELVAPFAADPNAGEAVVEFAEGEVKWREELGTYYPRHAEYATWLARLLKRRGRAAEANSMWGRAGLYLAGYGWRKDVTVFDLVDGAAALAPHDTAIGALRKVVPLLESVVAQTDGRSTKGVFNAWFRAVVEVDPSLGLPLLSRSIFELDGFGGWRIREALHDALKGITAVGNPALIAAVYQTMPFEVEYENEGVQLADERLKSIAEVLTQDRERGIALVTYLAAQVDGDGTRYIEEAANRVTRFAKEHDIALTALSHGGTPGRATPESQSARSDNRRIPALATEPAFPANPTVVDILRGLRRIASSTDSRAWEPAVNALGYLLPALAASGGKSDAFRILRFIARDLLGSQLRPAEPLVQLAAALDASGETELAASAHALAYTATRGGGGYLAMGDKRHAPELRRAIELSREIALDIVAQEIAFRLRGDWGTTGITAHLIERMVEWGDQVGAVAVWQEAFEVIANRLPLRFDGSTPFATLDPDLLPDLSVDEGVITLLIARLQHPLLRRKHSALRGLTRAIEFLPNAAGASIDWAIRERLHPSTLWLLLETLLEAEGPPFVVTERLRSTIEQYRLYGNWVEQTLADSVLDRLGGRLAPVGLRPVPAGAPPIQDPRRAGIIRSLGRRELRHLEPLWRDIPERVARRLNALEGSASEVHQHRMVERYKLSRGRDGNAYPPAPVLLWEKELFLAALDEELNGLPTAAIQAGTWNDATESSALQAILPNLPVHLGASAARIPRPIYQRPGAAQAGVYAPHALGDSDGARAGWIRIGWIEHQYVRPADRHFAPPHEVVSVWAGVVPQRLDGALPHGDFPFIGMRPETWWIAPDAPPARPRRGQALVGAEWVRDWLADTLVLIPPPELASRVELHVSAFGEPLSWINEDGAPIAAFRTWHVRNPDSLDGEPDELIGRDLIVDPTTFAGLEAMAGLRLVEQVVVKREALAGGDDEDD